MSKISKDRRIARTRSSLNHALLSLILEKGYEAITVEDLCARANIGRSTFYMHFSDKDDLHRSGLEHLRAVLETGRDSSANPEDGHGFLKFSLPMFEHAREHINMYKALAGNRGGAAALDAIRSMLSDMVRAELSADMGRFGTADIPRNLMIQYIVGAYMAILTSWLDEGAKLPPTRIDAVFRSLVLHGIASGTPALLPNTMRNPSPQTPARQGNRHKSLAISVKKSNAHA